MHRGTEPGHRRGGHRPQLDVLIDFDSPRSATAGVFEPVYAASARRHPDVVHATVDVEVHERLAEAAAVRSVPTMLVFRDGIMVLRESAVLSGTFWRN